MQSFMIGLMSAIRLILSVIHELIPAIRLVCDTLINTIRLVLSVIYDVKIMSYSRPLADHSIYIVFTALIFLAHIRTLIHAKQSLPILINLVITLLYSAMP